MQLQMQIINCLLYDIIETTVLKDVLLIDKMYH